MLGEAERRLTAVHEAGHAVVALRCPESDPIHRVTILPRGGALGMMVRLPAVDRYAVTRARLEDELAVAMGGRAAEELVFGRGRVSTGAAGDIRAATDIATRMVTQWGMSARFGMVAYGRSAGGTLAAMDPGPVAGAESLSAAMAEEVRLIIDAAHDRARAILAAEPALLDRLAARLLEAETLDAAEINALAAGPV